MTQHFERGDRVVNDAGQVGTVDHAFRLTADLTIDGRPMLSGTYYAVLLDDGDGLPVPVLQTKLAPHVDVSAVGDELLLMDFLDVQLDPDERPISWGSLLAGAVSLVFLVWLGAVITGLAQWRMG